MRPNGTGLESLSSIAVWYGWPRENGTICPFGVVYPVLIVIIPSSLAHVTTGRIIWGSEMVSANRVAAIPPPIDDTDPIRNFSIDPGSRTDWQNQAEFSPKGRPIRNFSIDPTSSIRTSTADAILRTPFPPRLLHQTFVSQILVKVTVERRKNVKHVFGPQCAICPFWGRNWENLTDTQITTLIFKGKFTNLSREPANRAELPFKIVFFEASKLVSKTL